MELVDLKLDLINTYNNFLANIEGNKLDYFDRYEPDLGEYYDKVDFPDNCELRFTADIFSVGDDAYLLSISFHFGDFNLGKFCQDEYPFERYLNEADGKIVFERLNSIGLYCQPEPIKSDEMPYKLFPDLGRKNKINSFLSKEGL